MTTYTIGEVAERSGFAASTLRYYEDHGLVVPARRTDAGYRVYDDRALEQLEFIARAKQLRIRGGGSRRPTGDHLHADT